MSGLNRKIKALLSRDTYLQGTEYAILTAANVLIETAKRASERIQMPQDLQLEEDNVLDLIKL